MTQSHLQAPPSSTQRTPEEFVIEAGSPLWVLRPYRGCAPPPPSMSQDASRSRGNRAALCIPQRKWEREGTSHGLGEMVGVTQSLCWHLDPACTHARTHTLHTCIYTHLYAHTGVHPTRSHAHVHTDTHPSSVSAPRASETLRSPTHRKDLFRLDIDCGAGASRLCVASKCHRPARRVLSPRPP